MSVKIRPSQPVYGNRRLTQDTCVRGNAIWKIVDCHLIYIDINSALIYLDIKMDIIVDIDGTIADCSHRKHFVTNGNHDWDSFYENMVDDKPIKSIVNLINSFKEIIGNEVILCTGRPQEYLTITRQWLIDNNVFYDSMYMRKTGDFRPDEIVKKEMLQMIKDNGFHPELVIDDRMKVVNMWKETGLMVLAVNGGDDF